MPLGSSEAGPALLLEQLEVGQVTRQVVVLRQLGPGLEAMNPNSLHVSRMLSSDRCTVAVCMAVPGQGSHHEGTDLAQSVQNL